MKIKTMPILLLPALLGMCATGQSGKSTNDFAGRVIMTKGKTLHAVNKAKAPIVAEQKLYVYRPQKLGGQGYYVVSEEYVGQVTVNKVSERGIISATVTSGKVSPGDMLHTQTRGGTTLRTTNYRGSILLCSKPSEIHVLGTKDDGLVPGTVLQVFRSMDHSNPGEGVFELERTAVGKIKIIKTAGDNYSLAKRISGVVEPGDEVGLK